MGLSGLIRAIFKTFIIKLLPRSILRKLGYKDGIAFIANLPNTASVPQSVPFRKLVIAFMRGLSPIVISPLYGFKDKDGQEVKGWVILCPITASEILTHADLARKRVIQAACLAERMGVDIVTLGAFTSIATHDGYDLIDRTTVGVTTGNPYSAIVAIQNMQEAARLVNLDISKATVAIVGAAGSVGSGCAKFLIGKVKKLVLVDRKREFLKEAFANVKSEVTDIVLASSVESIKEADVVIVVTSSVVGIIGKELLKPGVIVIDGANPPNISVDTLKSREDILVIASAIVKAPGLRYPFDFALGPEEAFGCVGEALALAWTKRKGNYALGKVNVTQMEEIQAIAKDAGLVIAPFRNALGLIPKERIDSIAQIIRFRTKTMR